MAAFLAVDCALDAMKRASSDPFSGYV